MTDDERLHYLRIALIAFGLFMFLALYPLTLVWPSGWLWQPNQPEYEHMILGMYATLGVFLLIASRNPAAHRSLIWFTVWSSVIHGTIMAAYAVIDPQERGHLLGDVPGLILVAVVLAVLMPRKTYTNLDTPPRTA